MATKERVLKFTVMQHRNPKISEAEFNTHWTENHAPIASAWLQRNGILGYTQVSNESKLLSQGVEPLSHKRISFPCIN